MCCLGGERRIVVIRCFNAFSFVNDILGGSIEGVQRLDGLIGTN